MAKEKDLSKTFVNRYWSIPKTRWYQLKWTVVIRVIAVLAIIVLLAINLQGCNDLIPTQEF